jgi:2-polyprenyl-6-methoxyphenol hydroxylase-like FAD-dependent oxidoreductase
MAAEDILETTDVLIVGCGPTGALLTALLGQFGVQNIVLEKEAGVTDDPRGITLDEDGIRLLQEVGIYDKVYTEMGSCEFISFGKSSLNGFLITPGSSAWNGAFHDQQDGFARETVLEVQHEYGENPLWGPYLLS